MFCAYVGGAAGPGSARGLSIALHLVSDARIDDPLAVQLSPKAFRVDPGKGVAGAVHTPPAVAPTDDCDEVACPLVVVSCDELG